MLNDQNDKTPRPSMPGGNANRFALVFLLISLALFGFFFFGNDSKPQPEIPYSSFIEYLNRGEVEAVKIIDGHSIKGTLKGSQGDTGLFSAVIPYEDPELLRTLREKGVKVSGATEGVTPLRMLMDIPSLVHRIRFHLVHVPASLSGRAIRLSSSGRAARSATLTRGRR
jgi:cell division protease FtsH